MTILHMIHQGIAGVIISKEGHLVTNFHVIEAADDIQISLNDGKTYKATVIGSDPESDLAILRVDTKNELLPSATLNPSEQLQVGDIVIAIFLVRITKDRIREVFEYGREGIDDLFSPNTEKTFLRIEESLYLLYSFPYADKLIDVWKNTLSLKYNRKPYSGA